jgi:hypothetical protein
MEDKDDIKNMLKNTLRNIMSGLGFLSYIGIILATAVWIAVGFQNNTLEPHDTPTWAILITSIIALLLTLLTYKDLGEVMSNAVNTKVPPLYHAAFSALTVIGYLGTVLTHYSLKVALPIIVASFTLKYASKKWLR